MRLKKILSNLIGSKIDNNGSVMVTVIITFFFVSILTAIILSTVSVNISMRSMDRKTKDEFYYVEKALNDIYNGIGNDCSIIMGDAYNETLSYYGISKGKNEQEAYADFAERFTKKFARKFGAMDTNEFRKYLVKTTTEGLKENRAKIANTGEIYFYLGTGSLYEQDKKKYADLEDDDYKKINRIVIEGISVDSNIPTGETGYVSSVRADMVIDIPRVSFFDINTEIFDCALMSNYGLDVERNATVKINGNVYAGTAPTGNFGNTYKNGHLDKKGQKELAEEIYGANTITAKDTWCYGGIYVNGADVTINDAKYVVSGGDIFIGDGTFPGTGAYKAGSLNINQSGNNAGTQIWFENIVVKGKNSTVNIHGDLYAVNDLQIEGDGSKVKIEGGYYGYNDGTLSMSTDSRDYKITSKESAFQKYFENDYRNKNVAGDDIEDPSALSSSIIVNGKGVKLDMSGLDTLVLMGNAYLDRNSKNGTNGVTNRVYNNQVKLIEDSLPESVGLKSTQAAFLVPAEFINGKTNPTLITTPGDPFAGLIDIPHDPYDSNKKWFGWGYLDPVNPYKCILMERAGGKYYAYCYLNFASDSDKEQYLEAIASYDPLVNNLGPSPTAKDMKAMLERVGTDYDISVNIGHDSETPGYELAEPTRIYSKNSIVGFSDDRISINTSGINESSKAKIYVADGANINLYRRYRLLDTYMEPFKEIPLNANVKDIGADLVIDAHEFPMTRFFWLNGIRSAVSNDHVYVSDEIAGSRLILIRELAGVKVNLGDIEIGGTKLKDFGTPQNLFILSDTEEELYIDSNDTVKINGFIVSKGKINVKEGATLEVTYNSTLINRRISKERELIRKNKGYSDNVIAPDGTVTNTKIDPHFVADESASDEIKRKSNKSKGFLSFYLLDNNNIETNDGRYQINKKGNDIDKGVYNASSNKKGISKYRMYKYDSTFVKKDFIVSTDYTNFVYYDNWKKGQH